MELVTYEEKSWQSCFRKATCSEGFGVERMSGGIGTRGCQHERVMGQVSSREVVGSAQQLHW